MEKDFINWHKEKVNINKRLYPRFLEREVWWCYVGANIGTEEDGKGEGFMRPTPILRKFGRESFSGIPLTSKQKNGTYYAPVQIEGVLRSAILHQARLFDAKRLSGFIERISAENFRNIRLCFVKLFEMP